MANKIRSVETAVSTKVVQHVAAVTGQEMTQLPPLYDTIDPDALDAIVDSVASDTSSLMIQFTYSGCQVEISGSGAVSVEKSN